MTAAMTRLAGVCYLIVIAAGVFAGVIVRGRLIVASDPTATARLIAENEQLWRWGIAAHALYLMVAVVFSVILYRLFKEDHPTLALVALIFSIVPVAIEATLLSALSVPLVAGVGAAASEALGAQRDAIVHLAARTFVMGWKFSLLLFAGFCAATGALIWRTRYVPRAIGVLMVLAGIGYFTNSVLAIIAPSPHAAVETILLLFPFVGETSLALWLAVRGARGREAGAST